MGPTHTNIANRTGPRPSNDYPMQPAEGRTGDCLGPVRKAMQGDPQHPPQPQQTKILGPTHTQTKHQAPALGPSSQQRPGALCEVKNGGLSRAPVRKPRKDDISHMGDACGCGCGSCDVIVMSGWSCHRAAPCLLPRRLRSVLCACSHRKAPIGIELAPPCLTLQLPRNLTFGRGVVLLVCLFAIMWVLVRTLAHTPEVSPHGCCWTGGHAASASWVVEPLSAAMCSIVWVIPVIPVQSPARLMGAWRVSGAAGK